MNNIQINNEQNKVTTIELKRNIKQNKYRTIKNNK